MHDNVKYAFDSAAAMLARGMRTRRELEQKLCRRALTARPQPRPSTSWRTTDISTMRNMPPSM
jgi:hypothetical protein